MRSALRQVSLCLLASSLVSCVEETRTMGPAHHPATAATPEPAPIAAPAPPAATAAATPIADRYRDVAAKILAAVRADSRAYDKLTFLCDRIGNRLSGSAALDKAVHWAAETFKADGLDARLEPVTVPAWVRGKESATLVEPRERALHMLGLGNSVGTPPDGVVAEVVCCRSFDELKALGTAAQGKIVLFTARMPAFDPVKGSGYGETVAYRVVGPSRAAAAGAVACLIRSVTTKSLQTPHTGMLRYDPQAPKIPAAALSLEDAEFLERLCAAGVRVKVRLAMEAHFAPDAESANVIGELRGSEKPDEVVVFGGHLNSWDVGQGAQDDGGPATAVMEAMRILKSLGLKPRRTIRAVLFVNEENGVAGGRAYAERHRNELKDHVAALEADSGCFRPTGIGAPKADDDRGRRVVARMDDLVTLLAPIGAGVRHDGGGGADIGPMQEGGVPQLSLDVDDRTYFDYHHTEADTLDKVDKGDLDLCVAALATTMYVLADMDERLGD